MSFEHNLIDILLKFNEILNISTLDDNLRKEILQYKEIYRKKLLMSNLLRNEIDIERNEIDIERNKKDEIDIETKSNELKQQINNLAFLFGNKIKNNENTIHENITFEIKKKHYD